MWTYTLDDNNPTVQALNGTATLTDSFTALTADGTAQVVTVTINGAERRGRDQRHHIGQRDRSRRRRQRHAGTPTAPAISTPTDVDNPADSWQAVPAGAATYGTYAMTAAGVWTYTLDNSNADGAGAQRRRRR